VTESEFDNAGEGGAGTIMLVIFIAFVIVPLVIRLIAVALGGGQ
jgi:hypothetical protein